MKKVNITHIFLASVISNILFYKPDFVDIIINIAFQLFASMLFGYIAPPFTKYKIKDWKVAWKSIYLIMIIGTTGSYFLVSNH